MKLATPALALSTTTWMGFQAFSDAPPPVLDQMLVATFGAWFVTMAMDRREQSPDDDTPTEVPVDWTDSAEKLIEQIEEEQTPKSFYCATGDHIVDEVIWLEQIALGCRPCMIKLRETLTKDRDITMRLWKGNPDGTLTQIPADPEKKPLPTKTSVTTPARQAAKRRGPKDYIREHQDWTCNRCGKGFDTAEDGFYNTAEGFVCKKCNGVAIKGGPPVSGLTKNTPRQGAKTYESVKADGGPYSVDKMSVGAGEVVKASGGRKSIRIRGDVGPGALVKASGGNCRIIIDGDVYQNATITASGGSCEIIVKGYIYDYAIVKASGGSCRVNHHGHAATAKVTATGGSATITDLGGNRDSDGGAVDFTRYQAPGPIATTKQDWAIAERGVVHVSEDPLTQALQAIQFAQTVSSETDEMDSYFSSLRGDDTLQDQLNGVVKQRMERQSLREPADQSKFFLATCVECGLLDDQNPVAGWDRQPPGYKCQVCLSGSTPDQAKRSYRKWRVQSRRDLPKAPKDRETYYVIDDNEVLTWFDGTWVRVLIPNRATVDR
ncbi:hypothetical protein KHO57_gp185 [Mycobacterium phage Phabba]|uniref:Uncharacterized protein n=1 Tax=Mycobacterium phage Phabba TaxID=2027899 RepID=A0A249XSK6_9CAUD|nr:hypothetical protein KHO57_gp185 [Mycobacterium phage Phabba]ASZ74719.1 hypothetical protein SEA_PHABBA_150 [Mycobacterium phage Phabba]